MQMYSHVSMEGFPQPTRTPGRVKRFSTQTHYTYKTGWPLRGPLESQDQILAYFRRPLPRPPQYRRPEIYSRAPQARLLYFNMRKAARSENPDRRSHLEDLAKILERAHGARLSRRHRLKSRLVAELETSGQKSLQRSHPLVASR